MKYTLTLSDRRDLKRIYEILTKHTEIMECLNKDSGKSADGGATMIYKVEITLEEDWT
ncbi:MAG: hypothetical protein UW28_C0002G0011 [Parcubacteria group bacterium GW2011_GWA2_44_13]|nr:MAG: hypothetical protein UW28_C0002G0011 [Parcubacteria group bacterium GW2011_GWA2_44_13]